jgi:hypothetical protein
MTRKSRGTYVLVFGLVVVVGGLALIPLPGPGLLIFAFGVVIAAIGVVVLLAERSAAKIAAMDAPAGPAQPPQ